MLARFCVFAMFCALVSFLTEQPLSAHGEYVPPQYTPREIQTEVSEEKFGQFRVERRVEDRRGVPYLPGPLIVRRATLFWTSADEKIELSFDDQGPRVLAILSVSNENNDGCLILLSYSATLLRPSGQEKWLDFMQPFQAALERCDLIDDAFRNSGIEEAKQSAPDFAEAVDHWVATSRELFGRKVRRCVEFEEPDEAYPAPFSTCLRWSS